MQATIRLPRIISRRATLLLAVVAVTSLMPFLCAQPSPAPATTAENEPAVMLSPFQINEKQDDGYRSLNSVTGSKTNTPLIETPQSIQIINLSFLLDQKTFIMADALRYTSGVTEGANSRGDRFEMRGFTSGIPFKNGFRDTGRAPRDASNFDRIEVAKGPASVTLSRTNPGGAMNILTKLPQPRPQGEVVATIGAHNFYRANVDSTGPLAGSKLLYRVNAAWQDSESFRDEFFIRRSFFTPVVTWAPTQSTRVIAEVEYMHDVRRTDGGLVAVGTRVVDVPRGTYYGEPFDRNSSDLIAGRLELLHTVSDHLSLRVAVRSNQCNEWGDETQSVGVTADNLFLRRQVNHTHKNYVANTYTQNEALFSFGTGPVRHKFVTGFEYGFNIDGGLQDVATIANISLYQPARGASTPGAFRLQRNNATMTWYREWMAQDQIYLFRDRLTLLTGVRYAKFAQRTNIYNTGVVTRANGADPNPRYGLVWLPVDGVSLYAVQSKLLLKGTTANPDGTTFDPVTSTSTEMGVKAELWQRRLAITATHFNLVQNNVLVPDPLRPGYNLQSGERSSKGYELDLTAKVTSSWQLLGAASFTDAKVSRDTIIKVGNKLANSPDHTFSLWSKYNLAQGALKGLGFGTGVIYVAARQGDINNTFTVDSYTRLDLSASYQHRAWSFGLNLRNAFDTHYVESAASRTAIVPGSPRNWIATVRHRF